MRFRKYLEIIKFQEKSQFQYLGNNIVWSFDRLGFVLGVILIYVFSKGGNLGETIQYIAISNVIYNLAYSWPNIDISSNIFDGKFSSDLLVPIPIYRKYFLIYIGKNIFGYFLATLPSMLILIVFSWKFFTFQFSILNLIFSIPLILIGYWIYFSLSFIVGLLTFWVIKADATQELFYTIRSFFRGDLYNLTIPALYFSGILYQPFAFTGHHIYMIFVGKYDPVQILWTYFGAIFWAIVLYFISKFILKLGLKKYESVGL